MSLKEHILINLKERPLFRFEPKLDTLIAVITAFIMTGIYYLNTATGGDNLIAFYIIFLIVGNIFLNVVFPCYYVVKRLKEPIQNLGITKNGWVVALLISIILAFLYLPDLLNISKAKNVNIIAQMIFNGIILWEVFFSFGWLQLRFEKAFGAVPAPILAGICFGLYHVGTYPLSAVISIAISGILYGALFGITRNLLTLFPIAWSVISSIGTISGGIIAQWSWVYMYAVVLIIQFAFIIFICKSSKKKVSCGCKIKKL